MNTLLTDHLITGKPFKSEPAKEKWFNKTIHTYKPYWLIGLLFLGGYIYEAQFECHVILMLGKGSI